jgi:predicted enzyme related to lactoylglutathione lyase
MDIPRVGRFAMLADPQGAIFGVLYRNEPAAARPMPPPPGAVVWNELLTSDAEAALKFYSALFGWALMTRIEMGPKGAYLVFGAGGVQMGGMMSAPIPGGPLWLPYVQVESADALVASAVNAGATLCLGPQTVPGGGRIANFLDPQGVMFAAHSMPAAAAVPAAKPAAKRASKARAPTKQPAAVARKAKSARRTGAAKVAKKRRAKPATKKSTRRVSKRKVAPARRTKTAKRAMAKKVTKRAVKKSARAKSKRTGRGAKRR